MRVAVVGAGDMGRWLANFAKNLGEVTISDVIASKARKVASELGISAKRTEEAAREAELILVAVPISKTPEVLTQVAKVAQRGALLADVASVKTDAVEAMKGIEAEIELVSLHPLFGPGARSVKGKDIVAVPFRPGKRYSKLKKVLREKGVRVTEMDADAHDRLMAIVQCMSHFVLLAYLQSMKSMKGVKRAKVGTPIFSALLSLSKAVLTGNPDVYGELQVSNKYAAVVRGSMIEACRSLDAALSAGDIKAIKGYFKEALKMFGEGEVRRAYEKLYEKFEEEAS